MSSNKRSYRISIDEISIAGVRGVILVVLSAAAHVPPAAAAPVSPAAVSAATREAACSDVEA